METMTIHNTDNGYNDNTNNNNIINNIQIIHGTIPTAMNQMYQQ